MQLTKVSDIASVLEAILRLSHGDGWGKLVEGYPLSEDAQKIPAPVVTWRVLRQAPADVNGRIQRKPRLMREGVHPELKEGVLYYYQPVEALVRFGAWHTSMDKARELAEWIEEAFLIYGSALHEAGATQIFWVQTTTDIPEVDRWRTDLVPVFMDYQCRLARINTVRTALVSQINVIVRQVAATSLTLHEYLTKEAKEDV